MNAPGFRVDELRERVGVRRDELRELAVLEDGLDVRVQLQLHKFIWHPSKRGV